MDFRTHLSATERDRLNTALDNCATQRSYPYPWNGLETSIRGPLRLVGYGSILNEASAAHTLSSSSLATRRPVVAFGVRRIFNYQGPAGGGAYGPPESPQHLAALNTRVTSSVEHALNGGLVDIAAADIDPLRRRELEYNLEPVACLDWAAPHDPPFFAYLLECTTARANNSLLPHLRYYQVCREGAAGFGPEFLDFFLHSTYLADGVTSVAEWETRS
ncbi:MAG: hypothetical protein GY953_24160 [bacterium]|nr:hypothetical protein [bacterium]